MSFFFTPATPQTRDLRVVVTPDAAAYFAGETLTARIVFGTARDEPGTVPTRRGRIGVAPPDWRDHGRRARSLAIGADPQEWVKALGTHTRTKSTGAKVTAPSPGGTILWAYTRLVAQFHPTNTYIPPDPLLPLRSMLLHQPLGSGSLDGDETGTRWQLSFGTGTVGHSTQPSLTGSLFGLAKDLVSGGSGGSLEEERKRVWNMKGLPVFETEKDLLGVDIRVDDGKEFVYSIQLPQRLPPSFRGKALRFTYSLVVKFALSGGRVEEVSVPVRIWAHVPMSGPAPVYDVLSPIMATPHAPTGDNSRQAVEVLTRHSPKVSFDIYKDGSPIATLTCVKSTFRLGESVLGVVTLRERVQQFCAVLETREIIPETLLPPASRPPRLHKTHAEHVTHTIDSARVGFSLDIPSDATPSFQLAAGQGLRGGLEWRLCLWFLVGGGGLKPQDEAWTRTSEGGEVVSCDVPITVLAGHSGVVKPSVFVL